MSTIETQATVGRVTVSVPFFRANIAGQDLFSIQPGVPSSDALSWASCLLDTVIGLLIELDEESNRKTEAACWLAEMAKAAIDSVEHDK